MNMADLMSQIIATLIGIFVGTLAAFAIERHGEQQRKKLRAKIILRSIFKELCENFDTLKNARGAYMNTPWGKSFYLATTSWETAVGSGDLPDIIGFELADAISRQYGLLVRIRYYVDLLTRLWFAPSNIPGYEDKRNGFNQAIVDTMNKAIQSYPDVITRVQNSMN